VTRIKICGLKRVEDAAAAAEAGADFLGFVFAPSRRRVEPEAAAEIIAHVKARWDVRAVGVFVNEDQDEMNRIARVCALDYVQLSGEEGDEVVAALDGPAIQVFHVGDRQPSPDLAERVEQSTAALVLLDTAQAGAYGGTGRTFNWQSLPAIERPFLLAGGLHAGTAADAVTTVRPWGLDVSSGVERDGAKEPALIRAFIARVRTV
jgi:phosphoribosylanthranilate isomerase